LTEDRSRGEDRVLGWLRGRPGTDLLGDDAALLAPPGGPGATGGGWLATVDPQIAGVHVPPDLDEAVFARRLLHVNLSDLAASGGEPAYALVALAAPAGFDHRRFFEALLEACREAGVRLAGGDLARTPDGAPGASATMTLLGTVPEGGAPLTRSAGRPGDRLWVGGTLGESGAGYELVRRGARLRFEDGRPRVTLPEGMEPSDELAQAACGAVTRHLTPQAQVALGRWLARRSGSAPAAALDLSDGLARDLPRLARESHVTAVVDAAALPLADGFGELCAILGKDPRELALGGGEDYVLLFTLPPEEEPPAHFGCHRIGHLEESTGEPETVLMVDGERRPMPSLGWDHLD
jgi:thiamine-monophosphate kinase